MNAALPRQASPRALLYGLAVVVALTLTAIGHAVWTARQVADLNRRIVATEALSTHLQTIQAALAQAQASQNAYLLIQAPEDLTAFDQSAEHVLKQLPGLDRVAPSTRYHADLQQIAAASHQALAHMRRTLDLRRDGRFAAALNLVESGSATAALNQVHTEVDRLSALLAHEQAADQQVSQDQTRRGRWILITLAGLASAVAGVVAWRLWRGHRRQEPPAMFCAWTKRVKHNGEWISFERYLEARFAIKSTHGISDEGRRQLEGEAATPVGPTPKALPPRRQSYVFPR